MKSFLPWVGGKSKLLWLIHRLSPARYDRIVDVFGGSGTVTLNHPHHKGCVEVYNDYNSDLVNLFRCARDRPMALARELNFLPLHSRDDFNLLADFLAQKEPEDLFLREELQIVDDLISPDNGAALDVDGRMTFSADDGAALKSLLTGRAQNWDVRRAAAYLKKIRCSYSGTGGAFGARPVDIRTAIPLIWACSKRLGSVVIENRDFESVIRQYGQEGTFLYCDPPYYEAECYEVAFPKADHFRLHRLLAETPAFVMVSYNNCPEIRELYDDFWIFLTTRPNSMSLTAGSEYEELVMTNYDPKTALGTDSQLSMFGSEEPEGKFELIHEPTNKIALSKEEIE
ncbi:MAG: DNA adenine methylase [Subdoligranulum sp.]|nr:DNA adenine methylase [Subdoligranulum sp.]